MAVQKIQMNLKTESGYNQLHPETEASMVLYSSSVGGTSVSTLKDYLNKTYDTEYVNNTTTISDGTIITNYVNGDRETTTTSTAANGNRTIKTVYIGSKGKRTTTTTIDATTKVIKTTIVWG